MPSNSIMRLPRGHRFRPKFDFTVMAPILGSIGSHWVQKWVNTVKNYHTRKFEFSPTLFNFDQKSTLRLWRQITVGTPKGPSWGQWDPIGSKKWVNTVKNYHTPKFEFSPTPRSSVSTKIRLYGYGAKSRWELPRVHHGPMGSHWVQKWVTTVKNYHAPKFEFSTTPRSSISTKIRLYGYGAKSRCRPPRVHFVANWVGLGPKNGSPP